MGSSNSSLSKCCSKEGQKEVCHSVHDFVTTVVQNGNSNISCSDYLREQIEKNKNKKLLEARR